MNHTGMCNHNNLKGYCPSCLGGSDMLGFHKSQMGSECQPGYYKDPILGLCLPTSGTLLNQAQGSLLSTVATGAASTPAVQEAGIQAAASSFGQKVFDFYRQKPVMAWGITAAAALFVVYGGMTFIRGK